MADPFQALQELSRTLTTQLALHRAAIDKWIRVFEASNKARIKTTQQRGSSAARRAGEAEPRSERPDISQGAMHYQHRWQRMLEAAGARMRPRTKSTGKVAAAGGAKGGAGKAGGMGGAAAAVIESIRLVIQELKENRDVAVRNACDLARYNGNINRQVVLLERQLLTQQYRMGKATAGTSQQLLESERRKNEAWQGWEQFQRNIENRVATGFNRMSAGIGETMSLLAKDIEEKLKKLGIEISRKAEQDPEATDFFNRLSAGDFAKPRNGRP